MKGLFFYNNEIQHYEKKNCCNDIIFCLEHIYHEQKNDKVLSTLVGYLWYFLIEGDVNQSFQNYNWKFMHDKLNEYLNIGFISFSKSPIFCFTSGYILLLHWMSINVKYEHKGKSLLLEIIKMGTNNELNELSAYILSNKKDTIDRELINTLFPTSSILDRYFQDVL